MRPVLSPFYAMLSVILLLPLGQLAFAQETPKLSVEERSALLRERDTKAEKGLALANSGEFEKASVLLDEVLKIEASIFGESHTELLGTLNYQARIAHAAKNWDREIEYRHRAVVIGKVLYEQDNYQLRDLELLYRDARNNATRSDQHRQQLTQASLLHSQGVALHQQGKTSEAISLAKQVVLLTREVLGKEHPNYATSVANLGEFYRSLGDYVHAEPLLIEARTIQEQAVGKDHPSYATCLSNLTLLYHSLGDFARAEKLGVEAKSIRTSTLGKGHPSYAVSVNNLAMVYQAMGDYARAEPLYVEAMTVQQETVGKDHPAYAASLNNLALLYRSMGDYARAIPMHIENRRIWGETVGKEHPRYAISLNNLAEAYMWMGDYRRAEPLFVESLRIREGAHGKEHSAYAVCLSNLALLYRSMGDVARSEPLYIEAKNTFLKTLGAEHPNYAVSLANLGELYLSTGDHDRAEPLLIEAKEIQEKELGKEHPMYATSLNNLATLYEAIGDYEQSEPLYIEAKTIQASVLGKEHPEYATSLHNLARLYESMGDNDRAEQLHDAAKTIRETVLGKEHPDYATSLYMMAALHQSTGDFARAEPLYLQAIDITLGQLDLAAQVQSEQQQLLMNQSVRYQLDDYVRCCINGKLDAYDAIERIVSWKGSILRRGRGLRLGASDPAVADQFRQLQSVSSQITTASRSVPKQKQIDAWRKRLNALAEQRRLLETELLRLSPAFRESVKKISLEDVRQSIPEGGILIDYLEYRSKQGPAIGVSIIPRDGEPRLMALCSAEQAGTAIDTWRKSYGLTPEGQAAGETLRRQLWDPLREYVRNAQILLVSTDGVLGRLPLAALPGREPGSFLIEEHRMVMIPVPQLLPTLVQRPDAKAPSHELLLVGDVDYGAPHADAESSWMGLPETDREVDFISELFKRQQQGDDQSIVDLRADAATESAFAEMAPSCRTLHLATHGFFAAADQRNALAPGVIAESRGAVQRSTMFGDQHSFVAGVSPGQLSGLVFAGANEPPKPIDSPDAKPSDDGIVTADEIAYLPLDGVELAVLSACETGLGEVAGGEALIGIQRAFQISGVDSVVASLWKVDDMVTRKLMERFYLNHFAGQTSKIDALREAQLWILRHPEELKKMGVNNPMTRGGVRKLKPQTPGAQSADKTSPYFWAAFSLSGNWR